MNINRMGFAVFQLFVTALKQKCYLLSTAILMCNEQTIQFLYFDGQPPSVRQMQEQFQHSDDDGVDIIITATTAAAAS